MLDCSNFDNNNTYSLTLCLVIYTCFRHESGMFKMLQFTNLSSVMEAETISKNGASPKSHMSRGNFHKLIAYVMA